MKIFGFILSDAGARSSVKIEAENLNEAVLNLHAVAGMQEIVSYEDITSYPVWDNCMYKGNRGGHSHGFCTANACY